MKPVLLSLAFVLSTFSLQASANQNQTCYYTTMNASEEIYSFANLLSGASGLLNEFNNKTGEALHYSLVLASGNTPPNDYLMTILNRADQNFFALKQRMDTSASHAQIINFSKLKNDFNACLTEEVKLKCPQAISNFNNRLSSLVSNYGESTRQFASLTPARNQVFSEMQNHYDNKIVMTPAKYQELSQIISLPIANFKLPLNRAHNDASAIPSIVENELADCFLR